jgi:hypothetical protein
MICRPLRITAGAFVPCIAFASLGCESSTVCAALPAWALEITVIDSITRVTPANRLAPRAVGATPGRFSVSHVDAAFALAARR